MKMEVKDRSRAINDDRGINVKKRNTKKKKKY